MKTKNFFFLLFVCILPQGIQGQHTYDNIYINRTLQDFASEMRFVGASGDPHGIGGSNAKIEGSEYLDENFVNGEIFTMNSEHFSDIPMRYNSYYDNIEVKLPDGQIYGLTDPKLIFQVRMNKDFMIHTRYVSTFGEKDGFLFVLHEGKCSLYRRNYKIFKEKVPSNGLISEVPAKIVDKPKEYYIRLKDNLPTVIITKKDLLLFLHDHSAELEEFFKKERVKLNTDEDMIRVVTFYNSL